MTPKDRKLQSRTTFTCKLSTTHDIAAIFRSKLTHSDKNTASAMSARHCYVNPPLLCQPAIAMSTCHCYVNPPLLCQPAIAMSTCHCDVNLPWLCPPAACYHAAKPPGHQAKSPRITHKTSLGSNSRDLVMIKAAASPWTLSVQPCETSEPSATCLPASQTAVP